MMVEGESANEYVEHMMLENVKKKRKGGVGKIYERIEIVSPLPKSFFFFFQTHPNYVPIDSNGMGRH